MKYLPNILACIIAFLCVSAPFIAMILLHLIIRPEEGSMLHLFTNILCIGCFGIYYPILCWLSKIAEEQEQKKRKTHPYNYPRPQNDR